MRFFYFFIFLGLIFANDEKLIFDNLSLKKRNDTYLLPVSYQTNKIFDDRKKMETKFQLSFEKKLFEFFGIETNFAYTQISFWQIFQDSAPFRESNYMPEIYLRKIFDYGYLQNFEIGLLHHSNGKGGEDSRSWNRIFLSSKFECENWQIVPKIWYKIKEKNDENSNIKDFYGYGEISAKLDLNSQILSLNLRGNIRTKKGAIELGWGFPLFDSGVSGYINYFSGYGESLIDYDKKIDKIGAGFILAF